MKKEVYITLYSIEHQGKIELSAESWQKFKYKPFDLITLHRTDGPAMEYNEGTVKHWFLDNHLFSEEEFNKIIDEVKQMSVALRLTDSRWWVREWK